MWPDPPPSPIKIACSKAIEQKRHTPLLKALNSAPLLVADDLKLVANYFESYSDFRGRPGRPPDHEMRFAMSKAKKGLKAYKDQQRALGRRVKHSDAAGEYTRLKFPNATESELSKLVETLINYVSRSTHSKKVAQ